MLFKKWVLSCVEGSTVVLSCQQPFLRKAASLTHRFLFAGNRSAFGTLYHHQ